MIFDISKYKDWITKTLSDLPSPHTFRLLHESGETIATFPIDGEELELTAMRIAEETMNAAADHIEAFEESQRYRLVAFDDEDMEIAQSSFRRAPSRGDAHASSAALTLENTARAPNEPNEDLVAVLTRHVENRERNFNSIMESVVGHLVSENQSLRRSQQKMDEMRLSYFEKREELMSEEHLRSLERSDHEASEARKAAMFEKALEYAPEVFKHLMLNAMKGQLPAGAAPPKNGQSSPKKSNGQSSDTPEQAELEHSIEQAAEEMAAEPPTIQQLQASCYALTLKLGGYKRVRELLVDELREDLDAITGIGGAPESVTAFRNAGFSVLQGLPADALLSLSGQLTEDEERMLAFLMTPTGEPTPTDEGEDSGDV